MTLPLRLQPRLPDPEFSPSPTNLSPISPSQIESPLSEPESVIQFFQAQIVKKIEGSALPFSAGEAIELNQKIRQLVKELLNMDQRLCALGYDHKTSCEALSSIFFATGDFARAGKLPAYNEQMYSELARALDFASQNPPSE